MKEGKTLRFTRCDELTFLRRGKVRDIYDLGEEFLIVSTDRISCFDVVLPTCIPFKGKVLNKLSRFWFDFTREIIPNHLISTEIEEYPESVKKYRDVLEGRSMIVKKVKPIPVECVVRGYLSGSGWKEYKQTQSVCGIRLPSGLKEADKLPEPIFTPATKEEIGHDRNVTQEYIKQELGEELASLLREKSLELYNKSADYAYSKGIIIADTKFEFGIVDGEVILIDEVLTPDSSRFWLKDNYTPGRSPFSLDKQFVRDYLESMGWDKNPPAPELPQDIVEKTAERYLQVLEMLTGERI